MNDCRTSAIQVALRNCLNTVKKTHYLGINDVADVMKVSRDVLYKWVQTGRIPACHIADFEDACSDTSLSRTLAAAQGYLLVPNAPGVTVQHSGVVHTHSLVATAMLAATVALNESERSEQAVRAISQAIDGLAALRHAFAETAR